MARSDFEKTYIWYNLVTIIYSEIGGALLDGFEYMLIEYPQRTQGQETVKTLQEKIIVEQSGLRFEMASTKHFHII